MPGSTPLLSEGEMIHRTIAVLTTAAALLLPASLGAGDHLADLDEANPYYPSRTFPKLIMPQWVGEPGVKAVVILGIDDLLGDSKRYEAFLRPILRRLKKID